MSHGVYLTLDDSFGGGRVLLDVCRLVTWSVGHSFSRRRLASNCYQSNATTGLARRQKKRRKKCVCAQKVVKKCQEVNEEKLKISKINQV